MSGCPWPSPDPGPGGCCSCPGRGQHRAQVLRSCLRGSKASRIEERAVQNALALQGLQTGKPARRAPLLVSCGAEVVTLTRRRHRAPLLLQEQCPQPPLPDLLPASLWGGCAHSGHKPRTKGLCPCCLQSKGTWRERTRAPRLELPAERLCVCPGRARLGCSLRSKHTENQRAQFRHTSF